jgi:hypothetical protein
MTRLDSLRALQGAVKAVDGDYINSDSWIEAWDAVAPSLQTYRMKSDGESASVVSYAAFDGSLDAAHALHNAVLPGWKWLVRKADDGDVRIGNCGPECKGFANVWPQENPNLGGDNYPVFSYTPAHAWLLAILNALIAQEETK